MMIPVQLKKHLIKNQHLALAYKDVDAYTIQFDVDVIEGQTPMDVMNAIGLEPEGFGIVTLNEDVILMDEALQIEGLLKLYPTIIGG